MFNCCDEGVQPSATVLFSLFRRYCSFGAAEVFSSGRHIHDVFRIDKIALVAPQKQIPVFLLDSGYRQHYLHSVILGMQYAVLSAVSRFDIKDRVGKYKVIRSVSPVKMYAASCIGGQTILMVYFLKVGRVYGIIVVLCVRVGNITD